MDPNGTPRHRPSTSASGRTAHPAPAHHTRAGQPGRRNAVPSAHAATACDMTVGICSGGLPAAGERTECVFEMLLLGAVGGPVTAAQRVLCARPGLPGALRGGAV